MSIHRADFQWRLLGVVGEMVRFADAKAGVLLATDAVLAAAAISVFKDFRRTLNAHPTLHVLAFVGFLALIASAACALACIIPRSLARGPRSLGYFAHIAEDYPDADSYEVAASKIGDDGVDAHREVSRMVWANSRIARTKYRCIAGASWALAVGLILTLVVALLAAL